MEGISCNTLRKANDYYGRLVAFMTLITTQDEDEFCRCYRYITGFTKPNRSIGHHIWNLMNNSAEIQRKYYARRKSRENEKQKSE